MLETASRIDSPIGRKGCGGFALAELAVLFIGLVLVREQRLIAG
jgi:hypothetical protein